MPVQKYDQQTEKEVQEWFEKLLERKIDGPFYAAIQDGSLLCKIANIIRPGSIENVHEYSDSALYRENVLNFLKFCKASCRVSDYDLFQPENLIDRTDYTSVLLCLQAFGRQVPRSIKEYKGPVMYPDSTPIHRVNEAEKARAMMGIFKNNTETSNTNSTPTAVARAPMTPSSWKRTLRGKLNRVREKSPSRHVADATATIHIAHANILPIDKDTEKEVISWIFKLTGDAIPENGFEFTLKNGVILSHIANALSPGCMPVAKRSTIAFRQMDNISKFRKFLLSIGMREYDVFSVSDLYEGEDIGAVIRTFVTLGKRLHELLPAFAGRDMVVKPGPVALYWEMSGREDKIRVGICRVQ